MALTVENRETRRDPRVDNRESAKIAEIRRGLLAMQRELDYPRWTCSCQTTVISREHDKISRAIETALQATAKLLIHYIDRETII